MSIKLGIYVSQTKPTYLKKVWFELLKHTRTKKLLLGVDELIQNELIIQNTTYTDWIVTQ